MKFAKSIRLAAGAVLAASLLARAASAETLSGQINYPATDKCKKLKRNIVFTLKGNRAHVRIGKKPDGTIGVDSSGNFTSKKTTDGDKLRGSVHSGKVIKKKGKCVGTFATR